jgi:hypothetical protein
MALPKPQFGEGLALPKKYSIDDFLPVIREDIQDAVDFLNIEFEDDFEKADRYFNGEVDIPVEEGRSEVVSTQVRDSIRNLRPSILRVLASNRRRLVKYILRQTSKLQRS